MAYSGGDEFPCVVAEVGSYHTRLGYAGEDYPRSIFRSTTAVRRSGSENGGRDDNSKNDSVEPMLTSSSSDVGKGMGMVGANNHHNKERIVETCHDFLTRELKGEKDGQWELINPINPYTGLLYPSSTTSSSYNNNPPSSSINSNDDSDNNNDDNNEKQRGQQHKYNESHELFSSYLHHGRTTALRHTSHALPHLLVTRSYDPPPLRQETLEILMEGGAGVGSIGNETKEYEAIPAAFLARDAVCAAYAVGRATGTVVDIGNLATVVTPVYEGFVEAAGIRRGCVGSNRLNDEVLQMLDDLVVSKRDNNKKNGGRLKDKKIRKVGEDKIDGHDDINTDRRRVIPKYRMRDGTTSFSTSTSSSSTTTPSNYNQRSSAFHNLARSEVARQCRDCGAGAGVAPHGYVLPDDDDKDNDDDNDNNDNNVSSNINKNKDETSNTNSYSQYQNAPKTLYKLPDGSIIDIGQNQRFTISELLFGNDTTSTYKRVKYANNLRRNVDTLLAYGLLSGNNSEKDGSSGVKLAVIGDSIGGGAAAAVAARSLRRHNIKSFTKSSLLSSPLSKNNTNNNTNGGGPVTRTELLLHACRPYLSSLRDSISDSSIPSLICEAVQRCDRERGPGLLGSVILCGGGACIPSSVAGGVGGTSLSNVGASGGGNSGNNTSTTGGGVDDSNPSQQRAFTMTGADTAAIGNAMPERIRESTEALVHAHTPGWKVRVLSPSMNDRAHAAWIGASILGSLGSFHEMWVTRAEYDEYGSAIVHRKCP